MFVALLIAFDAFTAFVLGNGLNKYAIMADIELEYDFIYYCDSGLQNKYEQLENIFNNTDSVFAYIGTLITGFFNIYLLHEYIFEKSVPTIIIIIALFIITPFVIYKITIHFAGTFHSKYDDTFTYSKLHYTGKDLQNYDDEEKRKIASSILKEYIYEKAKFYISQNRSEYFCFGIFVMKILFSQILQPI